MLPIMYEVFAKFICNRIKWILDAAQPVDQAGFRPGYCCEDHLLSATTIWEKCKEFNLPLWSAATDFWKAFDTVEHSSIWSALEVMGVPSAYIKVFAKLYSGQVGTVITDGESKKFEIRQGTK